VTVDLEAARICGRFFFTRPTLHSTTIRRFSVPSCPDLALTTPRFPARVAQQPTASFLAILLAIASPALRAQADPTTAAPTRDAVGPPRFDILEFVVEGDSLLGAAAIERAVYEFLGLQRTAAEAEGARRALEKAYQDAGFLGVAVVLPPQRVGAAGGEVKLQVVQATVDKLRVTGAQFTLPSQVREALPSVSLGISPNFNEMQQELSQLARTSVDREVTPVLSAGEQPGTLNVEMKVQDSLALHASVEVNSKQSQNTRAGRLETALSYDNLFQAGHSLGFNWFYSPTRPKEANIQSLNYNFPLGGVGDRLYLLLVNSNSDTPTPLGGATVSRGQTWRLRWRDELPAADGINHALTWGLTVHDLQDSNRDVAGISTTSPKLRYPSFSTAYELNVTGSVPGRQSTLNAEFSVSTPGLSRRDVDCYGTVKDQFACKRSSAGPGFQVFSLSLSHREPLGRWSLSARLQGQFSDTPLVPAEQVVYGGLASVRGYYEGEQASDMGAALRVELGTPPWATLERTTVRALAFYDRASLRRLYALPSEQVSAQLGSVGLGLRVDTSFGMAATLDWANVLVDSSRVDTATGLRTPLSGRASGRGQRLDFTLRQAF
jgi:hemolysin activation/secretion protein